MHTYTHTHLRHFTVVCARAREFMREFELRARALSPVCRSFNRKSYTHADTHKRSNNTPVCCCTPPSLCIWRFVCVCVCVAAHNAHLLAATTQNARSLAHNRLRMRAFYVCTPRMNELVPVAATAAAAAASAGDHTNADRSHHHHRHHHHHYATAATSARTAAPRIRKLTCAWIGKKKHSLTHNFTEKFETAQ